ncbi:MAG: hypothetical protein BWY45_03112 [Euryarchaeota archaeon ADurb.Bin294]|nr:MAG: hypothetical protein BWY45_03112 [Euryarchaeota archaeon ADurb.Bin294]
MGAGVPLPSSEVISGQKACLGLLLIIFRIGHQHRAILSVHDAVLVIQVLEIEDGKQVYRDL